MRRALVALSVVLLSLLALAPASVGASTRQTEQRDFRFFGSGFGHGLGMSQWGAYGLSRQGWSAKRILTHFYSGTKVGSADSPPARLRVGLAQGRQSVQLEAQDGDVEIRLGSRTGDLVATVPMGETWRVRVAGDAYRILDASGATVGEFGDPQTPIVAVYQPQDARVVVPEAGHAYGRGWIEFGLASCDRSCAVRLVLVIPPEEYLYGLGEVPSSWPKSAMQAQAIAARTYALTKAAASQHRSGCDCAVYASSLDQVYAGWDKEVGTDGDRWVAAVRRTENQVVLDGGVTIQAFYMSSSGGYTEDNEKVWGGEPIDYLRGVCDPGDYTVDNPNAIWEVSVPAARVTKDLGLGIGAVTGFGNPDRGVSGRIISITVNGENGSEQVTGPVLRSALGLADDRVWIDKNRQVIGEIRAKYDELGCSPGLPTSRQVAVAGGLRQAFEGATIFFQSSAGAHALRDPLLAFYLGEGGGPGGPLGFPISDVRVLDNGNLRASFEHGAITCADTICRVD